MTTDEVLHIAGLARIELTPEECEAMKEDMTNIIGYVSELNKIAQDKHLEKKVGARYNVLREDKDSHEAGLYTEDLLKLMPERGGNYLKVKKILGGDS